MSKQAAIQPPIPTQYRLRRDDKCWILEVGQERKGKDSHTAFTWKNDGYFTRLQHALEYLLDRSLKDLTHHGDLGELARIHGQALDVVRKLAEDIKRIDPPSPQI